MSPELPIKNCAPEIHLLWVSRIAPPSVRTPGRFPDHWGSPGVPPESGSNRNSGRNSGHPQTSRRRRGPTLPGELTYIEESIVSPELPIKTVSQKSPIVGVQNCSRELLTIVGVQNCWRPAEITPCFMSVSGSLRTKNAPHRRDLQKISASPLIIRTYRLRHRYAPLKF